MVGAPTPGEEVAPERRPLIRPRTARRPPPRGKARTQTEQEAGAVTAPKGVIVDGSGGVVATATASGARGAPVAADKASHDGDDEEGPAGQDDEAMQALTALAAGDAGKNGPLVRSILEEKRRLDANAAAASTDAAGAASLEREKHEEQLERLRDGIQSLAKSTLPLGRQVDFMQEDVEGIAKEHDAWSAENAAQAEALERERRITDETLQPLNAQLCEIEQNIRDQLHKIASLQASIFRNDERMDGLLRGVLMPTRVSSASPAR